jgi:uncharacterized protein (TIGR03435 family)
MSALVATLESMVGRAVIDRPGLTGTFDVEVTHARGSELLRADGVASADGVSLHTAIQEQLGLKLEPRTEPVEVLVIDSVDRPTPD